MDEAFQKVRGAGKGRLEKFDQKWSNVGEGSTVSVSLVQEEFSLGRQHILQTGI